MTPTSQTQDLDELAKTQPSIRRRESTRPSAAATTFEEVWDLRREILHLRELVCLRAPSAELCRRLRHLEVGARAVDARVRALLLALAELRWARAVDSATTHSGPRTIEQALARHAAAAVQSQAFLRGYLGLATNLVVADEPGVALTVIDRALAAAEQLREAVLAAASVTGRSNVRCAA